jgi:hypothetical protein
MTDERPPYRLMDSNIDARVAIADVLASAKQELAIFDRTPTSLREREYGTIAATERMRQLLLGGKLRKIRIALNETQGIESELPRLVALLGQFGGQVAIHRVLGAAREVQDVLCIADDHSVWRKPVYTHPRSILRLGDIVEAKPYIERFNEIWSASELAVTDRQAGL